MKFKTGLYAKYEKLTGSFIETIVKKSNEIHMSNQQSQTYFHELLTENEDLIYYFPEDRIPKIALSFNEDIAKSADSNYHLCDICNEYFEEKEMDFIPTQKDLEEYPGICSRCINC
jgi:hypothetical protein